MVGRVFSFPLPFDISMLGTPFLNGISSFLPATLGVVDGELYNELKAVIQLAVPRDLRKLSHPRTNAKVKSLPLYGSEQLLGSM